MLYRKGQGLSMNVIIIAAIALLILVILSVLVLRSGRDITEATQCEAIDGAECVGAAEICPSGTIPHRSKDDTCPQEDSKCCVPL